LGVPQKKRGRAKKKNLLKKKHEVGKGRIGQDKREKEG